MTRIDAATSILPISKREDHVRPASHTEWEEQQDVVKELSSPASRTHGVGLGLGQSDVFVEARWKRLHHVRSIYCSLSVICRGKKEEEEEEVEVEGKRYRTKRVEGDRMHHHGKFSEYIERLGNFVDEWEDLPWRFTAVSNRKMMFRRTVSRETWTFGSILLLFAHVASLNVKFLQNNSLTTSNFSVSSNWTVKLICSDYEWFLMDVLLMKLL